MSCASPSPERTFQADFQAQGGFEYDTGVFAVFQPKASVSPNPNPDPNNPNYKFTVEFDTIPSAYLWRQAAQSPP
jgi:hypothetical protein